MPIRTATAADLAGVLADLRPGDTLRLAGDFPATLWRPRAEALAGVTIDAAKARLPGGLNPRGEVKGLRILGGRWGPIRLDSVADVSIAGIVGVGDGQTAAAGVHVRAGSVFSLSDSALYGFRDAVSLGGLTDFDILRVGLSGMWADGLKVSAPAARGRVRELTVDGTQPTKPGVHPDAVQLAGAKDREIFDLTFEGLTLRGLWMQGLFADDGPMRKIIVNGATIHVGAPRALSFSDVDGLTLKDIEVSTYPGAATQANAHLKGCRNVVSESVSVAAYGRHAAYAVA